MAKTNIAATGAIFTTPSIISLPVFELVAGGQTGAGRHEDQGDQRVG